MEGINEFINDAGSAHKLVVEQTRALANKWQRSGLLEGLSGQEKQGMSVILENQAQQLLSEASTTNPQGAGSAGENWAGVALPLVRKVFGSIASKNFVSVQPMNLPAGLVFYMDFKYQRSVNGKEAGGSVYGITSGSGELPRGGFYGAGEFAYSINSAERTGLTITSQSVAGYSDVNFNDNFSASLADLRVYSVTVSTLTNPDLSAVRAFRVSGSGLDFDAALLPEFTRLSSDQTTIFFVVNDPATGTIETVNYVKQPTDTTRGDFEDRTGGPVDRDTDIAIPQIDLELRSETIVAKTRKLKAVWSPELAQDLNAYHSVDAEAELTAMLSDYVATEIDLEILDMLIANATTTEYWHTEVGKVWNGSTFVKSETLEGQAWTNMTWFQTLGQKMQKVSNRIHQLTMRGGANFAVVSPTVATIVETIPGFMSATDGNQMEFAGGITKVGSFQNRYTIYKNPYMLENVMLLGFRGSNFLETGAVYAPYIPLIMTPLVYDPNNFTPRRGVMTRYAKKIVRPEFFGKIYIDGLNTL
jgi:hypothetical protein